MAASHFRTVILLAVASAASAAVLTAQPRLRASGSVNKTSARRQMAIDLSIPQKPALRLTFDATITGSDNSVMRVLADADILGVSARGEDADEQTTDAETQNGPSQKPRDGTIFDVSSNRRYSHQRFFGETVCYMFDMEQDAMEASQHAADKAAAAQERYRGLLGQVFGTPLELYETAKDYLGRKNIDANRRCSVWSDHKIQHLKVGNPDSMMAQLPFVHQQTPSLLTALQEYQGTGSSDNSTDNSSDNSDSQPVGAIFSSNVTFCVTESGEILETGMSGQLALDTNGTGLPAMTLWQTEQHTTAAYRHHVRGHNANTFEFNTTHGVASGRCVDLTQGNVGASELETSINDEARLARINSEAAGLWEAVPYDLWTDIKIHEVVPGLGTEIGPLRLPLRAKGHVSLLHPGAFGKRQTVPMPKKFDPRVQWPMCPSIGTVRNQGKCGSCWAFAAATVLADRYCIASRGSAQADNSNFNFSLAAGYLVDCDGGNGGCQGGRLDDAWSFLVHQGVPEERCRPYKYCPDPNESKCMGVTYGAFAQKSAASAATPLASAPAESPQDTCHGSCQASKLDKYLARPMQYFQASMAYAVSPPGDIDAMQRELYTHGPVEVAFFVFSDFTSYRRGVYFRTPGAYGPLGGHAVRLLGWGESSMEYWLASNSWSPHWGLGGNFKIRRGTNECGIESTPAAGLPKPMAK